MLLRLLVKTIYIFGCINLYPSVVVVAGWFSVLVAAVFTIGIQTLMHNEHERFRDDVMVLGSFFSIYFNCAFILGFQRRQFPCKCVFSTVEKEKLFLNTMHCYCIDVILAVFFMSTKLWKMQNFCFQVFLIYTIFRFFPIYKTKMVFISLQMKKKMFVNS